MYLYVYSVSNFMKDEFAFSFIFDFGLSVVFSISRGTAPTITMPVWGRPPVQVVPAPCRGGPRSGGAPAGRRQAASPTWSVGRAVFKG